VGNATFERVVACLDLLGKSGNFFYLGKSGDFGFGEAACPSSDNWQTTWRHAPARFRIRIQDLALGKPARSVGVGGDRNKGMSY